MNSGWIPEPSRLPQRIEPRSDDLAEAGLRPTEAPPPAEIVARFLRTVRSGERLDLAAAYLADEVLAHQGAYGTDCPVLTRSPGSYGQHVADMLAATGPWQFEITALDQFGELVAAAWRQLGTDRSLEGGPTPQVEHGHATYLVREGRIQQYWIESTQHLGPCLPTAQNCRFTGA